MEVPEGLQPLEVVVGLIFNEEGEVLMTKRLPDKLRPGMWEMPGGKVDKADGEFLAFPKRMSDGQFDAASGWSGRLAARLGFPVAPDHHNRALARELREELGVDTIVGPRVSTAYFNWRQACSITLYHCRIAGTPKPLEAAELGWFSMDYALDRMPMCPAQYTFYPDVMKYMAAYRQLQTDYTTLFG